MTEKMLPGESLILKLHPHWVVLVKSLIIPILLVLIGIVGDFTLFKSTGVSHFRLIVSLVIAAIAGLWLIVVWIRWQATAYTLTNQRIILETGVFGRSSKIIPIDRVQDCSTKESVLGRMLGYGRVEVDAAGASGAEILGHLPNPARFRDQVFMQSEQRRGGGGGAPPANPSGV
jgi:uncharacterized membrane protein YdbT with pleckstrin-like domain